MNTPFADPLGGDTRSRWQDRAACHGQTELFTGDYTDTRRAKLICQTCPVRPECLTTALSRHEPAGVWGGKTPDERSAVRRNTIIRWPRVRCPSGHDLAASGVDVHGTCNTCASTRRTQAPNR